MFERFNEPARDVIMLAQDESRTLGHDYIGTEHILLGILREQKNLGARVLDSFGITAEQVRAQIESIVGRGSSTPTGMIPFTPRAKEALEAALREALWLGHNYIGAEHILLGLVQEKRRSASRISFRPTGEKQNLATRILLTLGAEAAAIRDEVVRRIP
jgi:ATP-dependent Clp protease ATP-binding subunit ClpC